MFTGGTEDMDQGCAARCACMCVCLNGEGRRATSSL